MEEQILAVDLSTEQTLEVNLPEQDNVAQIDVYWQDEVTLDLDASLMYIVSGQQEIQDYVENTSKPEIENYVKTQAEPIVLDVVNRITEPVVTDYIENNVKPQIQEFADTEMAEYAANATAQAEIATAQAGLSAASALAAEATLASVNNKAVEFNSTVNTAKSDIQSATSASITNINNTVSAEIIPNLEGYVSSATNQASIASSKANEAKASASAAKTSETNALNYSNQAKSYADSIGPETFVKTSGNQTVDGVKTFTSAIIRNHAFSGGSAQTIKSIDTNGKGSIATIPYYTNNNIHHRMYAENTTSGKNVYLDITISDEGNAVLNFYGSATNRKVSFVGANEVNVPTPAASDNSTKAATTAWVNSKLSSADYVVESYNDGSNWYRVYKSGWIEQGGMSEKNTTITFKKPYKDTNYGVQVTFNNIDAGNGTYGTNASNKTTTSFVCKTNTNGNEMAWYAYGY